MPKTGLKPRIRINERAASPEYIEVVAHDNSFHFVLNEDGPPQFLYLKRRQARKLRKFLKEHGA